MEENKKMVKSTMLYFVGTVFSKAIVFFLLPIYTKYINPTDYGIYEVSLTYINIFMSIVFFDIWSTILRYMYENTNRYKPIYSGMIIFVISSILYIIVFSIVRIFVDIPYSIYGYIYGIIVNLGNVYGRIARGFGKSLLFAISGIVSTIVNVTLNIILIVILKMDYKALYISFIIANIVQILMIESRVKVIKNFKIKLVDFGLFKDMLFFTLPFCMNSIGYWILSGFNKIYISEAIGNYEAGLYAVASKFSLILTTIADCFLLAWQELAFSKDGNREEKGKFFTEMINTYTLFVGLITIFILTGISIVFPFFIDAQYSEAKEIVPICIIGTVFSIMSSFLGSIFGSLKKNKALSVSTILGAIVNIVLAVILSKQYGIQGVNISMALGFLSTAILRYLILNRYIKLKLKVKNLLLFILMLIFSMLLYKINAILNIIILSVICIVLCIRYKDVILLIIGKLKERMLN